MDNKEAIRAIRSNWPDVRYTMLREALELAINALENQTGLEEHKARVSAMPELLDPYKQNERNDNGGQERS